LHGAKLNLSPSRKHKYDGSCGHPKARLTTTRSADNQEAYCLTHKPLLVTEQKYSIGSQDAQRKETIV